jgi:hypothetical protein
MFLFAACSGGDTQNVVEPPPTVPPPAAQPLPPGTLILAIEGLPGIPASISLTGPGVSRTATATTSWSDLPGGAYTITVMPVRAATGTYAADPSTISVSVVSGAPPTTAVVRYAPQPSALALTITGLPTGVAAPVRVFTPTDSVIIAGSSRVFTHPTGGAWRFVADTLLTGGFRYVPAPRTAEATVLFGDTANVSVNYALSSGALAVAVSGLPSGLSAQVRVRGPNSVDRELVASETLTDLAPGSYRVTSSAVSRSGITYTPQPDSVDVSVTASLVAAPAAISYAAQVGRLSISTTGLPSGATPTFTLTGPLGAQLLNGAATLDSLPVGQYQLTATSFVADGVRYAPTQSTRTVLVTTNATTSLTVAFTVIPTVVEIPVTGLPDGVNASVSITPPQGAVQSITGSTSVSPAAVGLWRVSATSVTSAGATYVPTPANSQGTATAGDTLRLPVRYNISTGSLAITVSGMPSGIAAGVTVTGPNNFSQGVSSSTTLSLLTPGTYIIAASSLSHAGALYTPTPSTQQRVVTASAQPVTASVAYAQASGAIAIEAIGLPPGVIPNFSITGASGTQLISGAKTVSGLTPGAYTVAAATLNSSNSTYTPTPSAANVTVTTNGSHTVTFTYAAAGALNYFISHVHVTQATQRLDGSVELVAGRDALLRVFVRSTAANNAQPAVRVRVYDGATLLQNATLSAPESSVRLTDAQGVLQSSWNLPIPAANMRPGLRVLAELDPTGAFPDANAADNVWPAGGAPQAIATRNVPTFTVRFVPVVTGTLSGNVSNGNYTQFLVTLRKIFPLNSVVADVRAPFTSSVSELQANDASGWTTLLSEMNVLRTVEGAAGQHYYGVVATNYNSGIAGYGYVPGLTAIGWDKMPSGDEVAAHEWGHNFSRGHAPCDVGGASGYPYPGGVIGQIGWNASTNTLVQATANDIMGYCDNNWISDYNWSAVLQYRGTAPSYAPRTMASVATVSPAADALLVWGRIVDGRISLEPAFRVRSPAANAVTGTHRVELLDQNGAALQTVSFTAERVDHITDRDERHFAVVVPWSASLESRLTTIRVRDARSTREARVQSAVTRSVLREDPEARVTSIGANGARISWNTTAYPMAMVRDASNGQILGFVRRSGDAVATNGRRVEIVLSDGVRSVVQR